MSSELCKYMRKRKVTDSVQLRLAAAQCAQQSYHSQARGVKQQDGHCTLASDYTLLDLSWCVQRYPEKGCLIKTKGHLGGTYCFLQLPKRQL